MVVDAEQEGPPVVEPIPQGRPAAEHDRGLHVLDLEPGLPGDVGQAPADGAVNRVHLGLLGVAVVPDQPAG
jgi:hypothetical protein